MPQPPAHPRQPGAPDGWFDAAAARAIIDVQHARVRATAYADDRVILGVWAIAWLVGYGLLWASAGNGVERIPRWAWTSFGVLLMSAVVTTIGHAVTRMSGVDGVSRRTRAVYGWTWFVAFGAGQALVGGVARAGAPNDVIALAANGVSALIVAVMYMAGGMLWRDRAQFGLGVWMAVVAAAAALVGLPGTFAVMCLAGGGGMAVGVLVAHVARARGAAA
ncbi:hypothetical protein [Cellulosimicrobium cellulans]|uniref:hypothetical protein n=1 Tax=Cellulosimicrobium cellulans TaxID=1710 RepID=UPI00130DB890|nr:hypothetical protein [Cellulosimicrobium cellulans]